MSNSKHLPDRSRYSARTFFTTALVLFIAISLSGCVVSRDPISGEKGRYGYSWAEEVAMGQEADAQIISQYGLYGDQKLSTYVDSLGQEMVKLSHLRRPGAEQEWLDTPFYFRVLDSPVVNAFALPGGYIYITRGLLAYVDNEAQLAVVIGHEIGHVAARHASKRAKNQMLGQAALVVGAVGGQLLMGGRTAEQVLNYGGLGAQLLFLSYGREDETQSDELGVEYASFAGYDASEGSGFFRTLKRMSDQSGQEIPSFMQTHPDPGQREVHIIEEAAAYADPSNPMRVGRSWYLNKIDDIVFGEDPRQGFVHEGRFVHPDLAFQFNVPDKFGVTNQPTQLVLISEDGLAAARLQIDSESATAAAAAEAFKQRQGMTVVNQGTSSIGQMRMEYIVADTQVEGSEAIRFRIQFFEFGGNVYSFLGFTGRSDFAGYDIIFKPMMDSFRVLQDQELLNIRPQKVSIRRAQSDAAFQSLAEQNGSNTISAANLAILNQLNQTDTVQGGAFYKLIGR